MPNPELTRCAWARNPLAIRYHDKEWGVPVHNDRRLFEFLILEGAQAGLSWDTILQKRTRYRQVFDAGSAPSPVKSDRDSEPVRSFRPDSVP